MFHSGVPLSEVNAKIPVVEAVSLWETHKGASHANPLLSSFLSLGQLPVQLVELSAKSFVLRPLAYGQQRCLARR